MDLLLNLSDASTEETRLPRKREAARAILFDEHQNMPLLYVSKHQYHKLPGGGIEPGENIESALVRECLEEVGCTIEITGKIGKITEYRAKWDFQQTSYCFSGKVISKGNTAFTEVELEQGFQVIWLSLPEAITTLQKDKPDCYEGKFIQKRDLCFLETMFSNQSILPH